MSENLQIFGNEYDGVNKIKVKNLNNELVTFVKEPVLIEKNITVDGIYSAEDDGVDGYSVVNVDVGNINNVLGEKIVTKNNTTYHAIEDGLKGYYAVTVQLDDLIEKRITEDGTYLASEDGVSGYSKVIVNGIGKVVGDDPEGSGDEVQASVDKITGKVVIKKIPSTIGIINPPTKIEYNDGEEIDYTGLVVKVYGKSGKVFIDDTYPDGIIPDAELDKPVQVAHADGGGGGGSFVPVGDPDVTSMQGLPMAYSKSAKITWYVYTTDPNDIVKAAAYIDAGNRVSLLCVAKAPLTGALYDDYIVDGESSRRQHARWSMRYNQEYQVYQVNSSTGWHIGTEVVPLVADYASWEDAMTALSAGPWPDPGGTVQEIPVNWVSSYDNKTLTDHFTITVNPAPEPEPEEGGETS